MSLRPRPGSHVPEETARVAQAAFPKGNPYLTLRDELETIYADSFFADLFPKARASGGISGPPCARRGLAVCGKSFGPAGCGRRAGPY